MEKGALVTLNDGKKEEDLNKNLLNNISAKGIRLETGGHNIKTFLNSDLIIVSPGVPLDIPPLVEAKKNNIPVMGEMELAVQMIATPIIAVTGTNGKTTSVTLLGEMIKHSGAKVFVGGNIGTPLIDFVIENRNEDYIVAEVSSFQLDSMNGFHPQISIVLNITPDHLDRYVDFEAYTQSKFRIFKDQKAGQYTILNDDDKLLSGLQLEGPTVLRYGTKEAKGRHSFLKGNHLIAGLPGKQPSSFDLDRFRLPGDHNAENLMAVVLAGLALGLSSRDIQKSIQTFSGLPHRMEFIKRIRGVDYYNDSKATNVDAASRSVECFTKPIILIGGGCHKGGDYSPLVNRSKGRVKKVVLFGEAKDLMVNAFKGVIPYSEASNMDDAVKQAYTLANSGDVVLLAPSCSSFDMFTDYKDRGDAFKKIVEGLGNGD